MLTVIGLDLAWTPGRNTGICIARFADKGVGELLELSARCDTPSGFADLAAAFAGDVIVAVDAPLIVGPDRLADRALARRDGRAKASPYQANLRFLQRMNGMAGPDLAGELVARGFKHCLPGGGESVRCFVEVFPHAAHVSLFELGERILYKKGTLAVRREGMRKYQGLLRTLLADYWPWAIEDQAVQHALSPLALECPGRTLKAIEDQLDALTCAFTAWHVATLGLAGCDVYGDEATGMIVVPSGPKPAAARQPV